MNKKTMLDLNHIENVSGMKTSDMPFGCRLCAEHIYKKHIISESENFFSVPDVRSLIEGHVQIISKKHLNENKYMFSAGHFPDSWYFEYKSFIHFMTHCIEDEFKDGAIWIEHGEKDVNPMPGSIYHPHIVGMPLGQDIKKIIEVKGASYFKIEPMNNGIKSLKSIVKQGAYYFYQAPQEEDGNRKYWIMRPKSSRTPSQLIMKFISEIPIIKNGNLEWMTNNNVSVESGEEYNFRVFRPADRFFNSLNRLRNRASIVAKDEGYKYETTQHNSLKIVMPENE